MADPILDEIWRVRAELVKKHGGIHGWVRHVQKLDRAHRQKRKKASKQAEDETLLLITLLPAAPADSSPQSSAVSEPLPMAPGLVVW